MSVELFLSRFFMICELNLSIMTEDSLFVI